MAASAGGETVMAPGNLVISAYVTCPDITKTVTPDLKLPGAGKLIHVDLAQGQNRRLGGSCLGQVHQHIGATHSIINPSTLSGSLWSVHYHETSNKFWQPVALVARRHSTFVACCCLATSRRRYGRNGKSV